MGDDLAHRMAGDLLRGPDPLGADWLAARAAASPDALALVAGGRRWRYGALDRAVSAMAGALVLDGMLPGQTVAALVANSPAAVFLVHAAARVGLILAPLNTRLAAPELAGQLRHLGTSWLLYDGPFAAVAESLARQLELEARPLAALEAESSWLTERISPEPAVQSILFTSGTSGAPKGVRLTYANHFWSAAASAFRLGLHPGERWLSVLPLHHVGGMAILFRSVLYGTAVVLQERFDVDAFDAALDEEAITMTSLVPTMLYRLLEARSTWPDSLRLVLLGGAASSPELLEAAQRAGVPVAPTYGLTEAASQVATLPPDEVAAHPGSVGRPLLFTQVAVVDEAGERLPPGAYGEIVVRGPTVMAGYYENEAATARALRGGWLHTGDIGYLDDGGRLYVVQRRHDVISSGGEKVYPTEVEAVLRRHPAVAAACVVGAPDPEWGEQVAAMVVLAEDGALSEAQLGDYCRRELAGYKLPRRWKFVDALPQTASGKVARAEVAATFTN